MGQCSCTWQCTDSTNAKDEKYDPEASILDKPPNYRRLDAAVRHQHVGHVKKTLEILSDSFTNLTFQNVYQMINTKDNSKTYNGCCGNTLGHIISFANDSANNAEILQVLINYGHNINITNDNEQLPIHLACCNDNKSILKYLIDNDKVSNINEKDKFGNTPIMIAMKNNSNNCINILLKQDQVDLLRIPTSHTKTTTITSLSLKRSTTKSTRSLLPNTSDINRNEMCNMEYCACLVVFKHLICY